MTVHFGSAFNLITQHVSHSLIDYLDLKIVQQLIEEVEWSSVSVYLSEVFSNQDYVSASFQQKKPSLKERCPIDKVEARKSFELLSAQWALWITTISERSKRLIQSMTRSSQENISADALNIIVILFQCREFIDVNSTKHLLQEICGFIIKLSKEEQDRLFRYLIEPTPEDQDDLSQFRHVLQIFQSFLSKRLQLRTGNSGGVYPDVSVIDATKCIAVLYSLNEQQRLVSYTEFYNETVNEQIEIKEDFPNYKDKKGFSFCDYPFLLNPAVKADVLKVESVYQMRHELQDAFFRALFQGVNSPYLVLEIRRDYIIADTLLQLEEKSIHDLKKQLRVQFVGEEGVDEGGVQKEFFQLIVREIFDPKYGLFNYNEESRLCWFSHNPVLDNVNVREYKLIGLLLGLAVYNSVILDLHFPLALYKKLMNVDVGLSDLKQLDPTLGKGLEMLLQYDGDIEAEYDRSFQVSVESFGHVFTYDLKPNGAEIQLTKDNRIEFVELYTKFILDVSVKKQFEAFKEGFMLVCQDSAIKIFRPEEVEQLICGCSDLDFEALEKSTVYDGGWTKDSDIIKYFWEIAHSFSYEEKKKLLFFATGSDRAPIGGLSKLQFVIAKNGGDSDRLPTSHTCYNVLLLCEYSSKEKLKERLLTSISNAEGFGMI
ncbi:putative E3 ubiquitin-protein ligase HTD2 [Rhizopus azygosporus]|uniref:HECT-type E3 ubiquitin transferase n=1 Tax=Rhizopus azygosporus TaxID=86630 RepID=A0A367J0I2_RHIAZ|nr:putative E3 ubiquitin-protein ligase HTD2 [Rhizopus azygosporus]